MLLGLVNFAEFYFSCLSGLRTLTGISSQIRTKLRDPAVWQVGAGCYSQAAVSSNDSKTLLSLIEEKGEMLIQEVARLS